MGDAPKSANSNGWALLKLSSSTVLLQVLAVLFVAAVPLFLITNSVSWAVNDLRLYSHGFDKYDIALVTGIERDDLMEAARQIRGYFNSSREPLEVRTRIFGEERDLFNEIEVLHMYDVKRLIRGMYGVDIFAAAYLLGFVSLGFVVYRRLFLERLFRLLLWGSGLTVAIVLLVGLMSLADFESLFLFFHETSFSNDFWRLDPNRDYLLMMFPDGFWFDATIFVALATVGQAIALAGVAVSIPTLRRWQKRRDRGPLVQRTSKAPGL